MNGRSLVDLLRVCFLTDLETHICTHAHVHIHECIKVHTGFHVQVAGSSLATGPNTAGRKVAVRLLTNAGPGEGGCVTSEAPDLMSNRPRATGQYCTAQKGRQANGTPLLKSALQKNVRLCRPACAVRYALLVCQDRRQTATPSALHVTLTWHVVSLKRSGYAREIFQLGSLIQVRS